MVFFDLLSLRGSIARIKIASFLPYCLMSTHDVERDNSVTLKNLNNETFLLEFEISLEVDIQNMVRSVKFFF